MSFKKEEMSNLAQKLCGIAYLVGDKVEKVRGYKFPGVVVARFETLSGETRYVVECTAEGAKGCLHIYSEENLIARS